MGILTKDLVVEEQPLQEDKLCQAVPVLEVQEHQIIF
tara:strand:+ start:112 stop:222 length:111 start_codon:yes stop_codon:yes gene_type:complete